MNLVVVEVLGQRRCGNQQLTVRSGHDGCQNSRQEDTGDEYREDLCYHADIDGLLVAVGQDNAVTKEHAAGNADHNCSRQGNQHPDGCNAARFLNRLRGRNTHETDKDMRLTEVAETPCEQRDNAHCSIRHAGRTVNEHIQEVRIERFHLREELGRAAHREDSDGRNREHAEKHQNALEEVGPANGEKAARKRIRDNDHRTDHQRNQIRDAEYGREQLRAGHKAGRGVEQEKHQNEHRCNNRNPAAFIVETVFEELRQRNRVACGLGVLAQTLGNEQPVKVSADCQTNGDPACGNTGQVRRTRQAHQQPAGHIGRLCAQAGYPRAKLSAAQKILICRAVFADEIHTYAEHKDQVTAECRYCDYAVESHMFYPPKISL